MSDPVLDNHLHLDRDTGEGLAAVRDFSNAGGTHMMIVNQPSWKFGIDPEDGEDFHPVFEETIAIASAASEVLTGTAWPVLGVHPVLLVRLIDDHDYSIDDAERVMKKGLAVAGEYAAEGPAVAIKSGRPHFEVPEEVWDASNRVLREALRVSAEAGVAVQLHTEETTDLTMVSEWAESAGVPPERVVKHYASGICSGVSSSVISRRESLVTAAESGEPFLMETDYLDDPSRPGAVLGPKTVPRRTTWLRENGYDSAVRRAHAETPERVYGISMTGT
jgi:TatD-related deoxyribonuclease